MTFIILIIFSYSCSNKNKSQVKKDSIFYYERLHDNMCNMNTNVIDSSFSYTAMVVRDTIDNLKKVLFYSYHPKENKITRDNGFIIRKEPWGLSRIIYLETDSPFLRIDTKESIVWEYPEETAKYIFSTEFQFLRKDTLYIKSLAKSIPVFVFKFSYVGENQKSHVYLDENFILVAQEFLDFPDISTYKMRLINIDEVPDNFRILLNDK